MTVEKTQQAISEDISLAANSDDLETLINASVRITANLHYLANFESQAHGAFVQAYALRKQAEARATNQRIAEGYKVTESQSLAVLDTETHKQAETDAEAMYKELQLYRIATSEFIGSLQQKISYLKLQLDRNNWTPHAEPPARATNQTTDNKNPFL